MQLKYDNPECQAFVDDLTKFGYAVRHLWRVGWTGPSTTVADLNAYLDLTALTDTRVTREPFKGGGFLVRPLQSGALLNDPDEPSKPE